jgi:hypothetical protein
VTPDGWAKNWIESGTWPGSATNRMEFVFRCDRAIAHTGTGYGNIQIGTYTKSNDGNPSNQGAHFYHLVDPVIPANRWVYLTLTRRVQHQVGGSGSTNWPENTSYYDQLTRFYFDTQSGNWSGTTCQFQPITFEAESGEADSLVQATAASYSGSRYEVNFTVPKNSSQQYTIRYSTSNMKTTGFASGTLGGTVSATGNDYVNVWWSSPNMAQPSGGLYIAIQPNGQSAFTQLYVPAN